VGREIRVPLPPGGRGPVGHRRWFGKRPVVPVAGSENAASWRVFAASEAGKGTVRPPGRRKVPFQGCQIPQVAKSTMAW